MKSTEILDKIGTLIAQDKISEAIEQLMQLLKGSTLLDELILHSARYNSVMKQIRMGTIDHQQADLSKNKIRFALIDMVSTIEDEALKNPDIEKEIERINDEKALFENRKNINNGNINTKGGNVTIGDNNISIQEVSSSTISIIKDKIMK